MLAILCPARCYHRPGENPGGDRDAGPRNVKQSSRRGGEPNLACVHDRQTDPIPALSELEIYAEHRAALDATVFEVETLLLLELRDGALFPRG